VAERKRVLITGAGGRVGGALRKHLRDRYDQRLLLHQTIPDDLGETDEVVLGNIADFEQMVEAAAGVDAIVHLALSRHRRRTTRAEVARQTIDVDMRSCYNIYEAARINGVPTVVGAREHQPRHRNE